MRYIDSTSIRGVSSLLNKIAKKPEGAGMYSVLYGAVGLSKMSRAQRKKLARRRYRMFVDNIIMHHKRLHDNNRQITIDLAKSYILQRKKEKERTRRELERKEQTKWRDKYTKEGRAIDLKERINARRVRAKSSWVAMVEEARAREGNF